MFSQVFGLIVESMMREAGYSRPKEQRTNRIFVFVRSRYGHSENVLWAQARLSLETSSLQGCSQQFRNAFFFKRAVAAVNLICFCSR